MPVDVGGGRLPGGTGGMSARSSAIECFRGRSVLRIASRRVPHFEVAKCRKPVGLRRRRIGPIDNLVMIAASGWVWNVPGMSIESDDLAGQARDGKVRWTACPTHRLDDLVHQVEATCGLTVQRTDRAKCARLHARREKIAAPVCRQRRARLTTPQRTRHAHWTVHEHGSTDARRCLPCRWMGPKALPSGRIWWMSS